MTYLSRISLNPLRSGAQKLISDPEAMHAATLGGLVRPDGRVLWRLEVARHRCEVLVLTPGEPSWEHLVEQAGWAGSSDGAPQVASCDALFARVAVGRQYRFRTRLNPTKFGRPSNDPEGDKRRRGLSAQDQADWFVQRACHDDGPWGFSVGTPDQARVTVVGRERLRFTKGAARHRVTLDTAIFEGVLQVSDVDRFRTALTEGIGRGKAYGCGLLTLSPVSASASDVVAG